MKKPMPPMKDKKDAAGKEPKMPFWMKSKMGMGKKKPSDNDGDE